MHTINLSLMNKVINLSMDLIHLPDGRCKHFSFICKRNNILSIGWNSYLESHPLAKKYGYCDGNIHSELDAVIKFKRDKELLKDCFLINTRVNIFRDLKIAKPCFQCQNWLKFVGFKKIVYSNNDSKFETMKF